MFSRANDLVVGHDHRSWPVVLAFLPAPAYYGRIVEAETDDPIYFDSDTEVIDRAIASLDLSDTKLARIVRVASTLSLHKFQASEAYQDQIRTRSDLVVTRAAHDMEFDQRGDLLPL
jgi:hypothetical protein